MTVSREVGGSNPGGDDFWVFSVDTSATPMSVCLKFRGGEAAGNSESFENSSGNSNNGTTENDFEGGMKEPDGQISEVITRAQKNQMLQITENSEGSESIENIQSGDIQRDCTKNKLITSVDNMKSRDYMSASSIQNDIKEKKAHAISLKLRFVEYIRYLFGKYVLIVYKCPYLFMILPTLVCLGLGSGFFVPHKLLSPQEQYALSRSQAQNDQSRYFGLFEDSLSRTEYVLIEAEEGNILTQEFLADLWDFHEGILDLTVYPEGKEPPEVLATPKDDMASMVHKDVLFPGENPLSDIPLSNPLQKENSVAPQRNPINEGNSEGNSGGNFEGDFQEDLGENFRKDFDEDLGVDFGNNFEEDLGEAFGGGRYGGFEDMDFSNNNAQIQEGEFNTDPAKLDEQYEENQDFPDEGGGRYGRRLQRYGGPEEIWDEGDDFDNFDNNDGYLNNIVDNYENIEKNTENGHNYYPRNIIEDGVSDSEIVDSSFLDNNYPDRYPNYEDYSQTHNMDLNSGLEAQPSSLDDIPGLPSEVCDPESAAAKDQVSGLACFEKKEGGYGYWNLCVKDEDKVCVPPEGVLFMYSEHSEFGTPLTYPELTVSKLYTKKLTNMWVHSYFAGEEDLREDPKSEIPPNTETELRNATAFLLRFSIRDDTDLEDITVKWEQALIQYVTTYFDEKPATPGFEPAPIAPKRLLKGARKLHSQQKVGHKLNRQIHKFSPKQQSKNVPSTKNSNQQNTHKNNSPQKKSRNSKNNGIRSLQELKLNMTKKHLREPGINIYVRAEVSLAEELKCSTELTNKNDLILISLTGLLIFGYIGFMNYSRTSYRMKIIPAFCGGIAAMLGYIGGVGLCYLCGLAHTNTAAATPFLILGVGVDDMFVIINSYTLTYTHRRALNRLVIAMQDSGLSITITTLTNVIAFIIGASSPYLAIRNFCIFTAAGLALGYVMVLTFFLAALCLSAKREEMQLSYGQLLKGLCKRSNSTKQNNTRENKSEKNTHENTEKNTLHSKNHPLIHQMSTFKLVSLQAHALQPQHKNRRSERRGESIGSIALSIDVDKEANREIECSSEITEESSSAGLVQYDISYSGECKILPQISSGQSGCSEVCGDVGNGDESGWGRGQGDEDNEKCEKAMGEKKTDEQSEKRTEKITEKTEAKLEKTEKILEETEKILEKTEKSDEKFQEKTIITNTEQEESGIKEKEREKSRVAKCEGGNIEDMGRGGDIDGEREKVRNIGVNNVLKTDSALLVLDPRMNSPRFMCKKYVNIDAEAKMIYGVLDGKCESTECSSHFSSKDSGECLSAISASTKEGNLGTLKGSLDLTVETDLLEPEGNVGKKWRHFFLAKYGHFITKPTVKLAVLLIFAAYLVTAIVGCTRLTKGLDITQLAADNSYLSAFFQAQKKSFSRYGTPISIFFPNTTDFWSPDFQADYEKINERIEGANYTMELKDGLKDFFASPLGNDLDFTDPDTCNRLLRAWVRTPSGSNFASDFEWKENGDLRTFRFVIIPPHFDTSTLQVQFMDQIREDLTKGVNTTASAYNEMFVFYESDRDIVRATFSNMAYAAAAMILVAVTLLSSVWSGCLVILTLLMIDVGVVGFMQFWNLPLNMLTMVNLIISIGFAVDYSAHMCHTFSHCLGASRDLRVRETLALMGNPVLHGAFSTQLGVLMLAFSYSHILRVFFKMMTLVLILSVLHGLLFLPVVLSLLGPMNGADISASQSLRLFLTDFVPLRFKKKNLKSPRQF